MINVTTAKTAELVAFYNEHASKPITKFSDRKTAERRVAELLTQLQPVAAVVESAYRNCPACGSAEVTVGEVVTLRGIQRVVNEHKAYCHACSHEFDYNTGRPLRKAPAANPARAASIARSWKNQTTAAARATRHHVKVGDKTFKSVREAFIELALPLGQHIKFRGQLKAQGAATFGRFQFTLV